jgi:anaerobic selenocysteine-containing dehydrogenase
MGFEENVFDETVDEMIDTALASSNPWLKGIDRVRLEKDAFVRLNFAGEAVRGSAGDRKAAAPFLPFANGGFQTPSGKAELYAESLRAQGLDPVAEFVAPTESRHSASSKSLPLELLARKADNFLNTTFCNIPSVEAMEEIGLLEMHGEDAGKRGVRSGDRVRVFNGRGELHLRAHVNGAVQPGVVSASLNWAKFAPEGRNINVLTSEKLTDMGNSATFYSVLVEVELAQPSTRSENN